VEHVKFESSTAIDDAPAAHLTFELHNQGLQELTDIVLTMSVLTPPPRDGRDAERAIIAGPLTIRSKVVLLRGYSIAYDVNLGNLSAEGHCVPAIRCGRGAKGYAVAYKPGVRFAVARSCSSSQRLLTGGTEITPRRGFDCPSRPAARAEPSNNVHSHNRNA